MTIDKRDYIQRKQEKAEEAPKNNFHLNWIKQISVKSSKLVGSPEWDAYQSIIEGILEDTIKVRDQARSALESPHIVNQDKMMHAKLVLRESEAIIGMLKQLVHIPYAIVHEKWKLDTIKSNIPLPQPPEFVNKD